MSLEQFEEHLLNPQGLGEIPATAECGDAGGAACGDLIKFGIVVEGEHIIAAGFEASGCGAMTAAGSAAVTLLESQHILQAARIGANEISTELGGLSPAKFHAADLVADAMHWALGRAARKSAQLQKADGRTLIAMSGGVDSTVVALLISKEAEEQPVGVTLELWADADNDAEGSCCSAVAVRSARALAHRLGLPHFTVDLREEFRSGVIEPYLRDQISGLTPNPCVRCNGFVRLDEMLDFASQLGAQRLATGHYAQVTDDGNGPLLKAAVDSFKDQSYMLAALAPDSVGRMLFPLGELTKPEVRALAEQAKLSVAKRPDSQDLCFLAGTERESFLAKHAAVTAESGEVVRADGTVVGIHRGYQHYTVGQRRGLGVAHTEPLYVLSTDPETNRVVIGEHAELAASTVTVRDVVLNRGSEKVDHVKLRYRSRPSSAQAIERLPAGKVDSLTLKLSEPSYGVAPGQVACLMSGEVVVGWGTIEASAH